MSKLLLTWIILILSVNQLKAQDDCQLQLYGKVSDEHDGSNLAYANLQLIGPKNNVFGVASDIEGRYEVDNLCLGSYTVIVSHIGCNPDTLYIDLRKSKKLNIQLEHHLEELAEIEIAGEREKKIGTEQLSEEQERNYMGESMADMLKQLPGVNTFKSGANVSKPMIGAFTSNRIQIINHGVQHLNQNWGDEHAPEIDPLAEVNYTVIKGASAVKYGGGAIGGFVLVEPKALRRAAGIGGKLKCVYASNNRMYSPSLMLEGSPIWLPNLSWRAEGSFRKAGNIKSPDYFQDNTAFEDQNYSWNLAWFANAWKAEIFYSLVNTKLGIFSGAHVGNLTDLRNTIESGTPRAIDTEGFSYNIERPYQLITHELLRAKVSRYFENGKLDLQLSRQFNIREEFDKDKPRNQALAALDIPEFSLSLKSYTGMLHYEVQKGNFNWQLGSGLISKENTVNSFIDFIPDYQSLQLNAYGLGRWERESWNIEGAIRIDQTSLKVDKIVQREYVRYNHDFTAFTSSLGFGKALKSNSTLALTISYAERAPAINELYSDGLHHGTASLEFGDATMKKERSYSLRSEWYMKQKGFTLNVQAYAQYIQDFIYLEPNGIDLNIRGAFPLFNWKNTEAFLRGVDLRIDVPIVENLNLSHKSSWLVASQAKGYLVNIPSNRFEHQLQYHLASIQLNLFASHEYVFTQDRYDAEVEIAKPPAAYQLISAGMNKAFYLGNRVEGNLGLKVNNLLNTTYRDYLNRFRYYADEMGRDIRITVELNF